MPIQTNKPIIFEEAMNDSLYYNAEAAQAANEQLSFSFGANWKKFLDRFEADTLACAEQSFVAFTSFKQLNEHDFLDVGSGSGLSSLVALRLGARKVVSVDIDPHSIDCALALREKFAVPESRWDIRQGSVLDLDFMESLGQFSYAHSWGVLHHTGNMWQALGNMVKQNVLAGGYLHLALYNTHRTSSRWLKIKRLCNRSPRFWYPLIKYLYISGLFSKLAFHGKSPIAYVRNYRSSRGMTFYRDIDDWIGGLPYEHASPPEIVNFHTQHGFGLVQVRTTDSCGCNEFLFQRLSNRDAQ